MDFKHDILRPGLGAMCYLVIVSFVYFVILGITAPVWPVLVIAFGLTMWALALTEKEVEQKKKEEKEHEEELAMKRYETEVRMRLEAEQKQAKT